MSQARLRIVFMGTPDLAATVLDAVSSWCASSDGDVVGVYCQPDRPAGRGHKLVAPPVKTLALSKGLSVFQPLNFRDEAVRAELAALRPDILAVAAYGLILPQAVLDMPRLAPLNVHGSLLPKYRGAAPIQRAIMDGETETGVSIMRMEAGLDSGPVFAMRSIPVGEHTAGSMHDALARLGGEMLVEVMHGLHCGTLRVQDAVAQDHTAATHAAKMRKEEGIVDWSLPATVVHAQIRGVSPWPGAQTHLLRPEKDILRLLLTPGAIGPEKPHSEPCGQWHVLADGTLAVSTADRYYLLDQLRPEGKKNLAAAVFVNGYLSGSGVVGFSPPMPHSGITPAGSPALSVPPTTPAALVAQVASSGKRVKGI